MLDLILLEVLLDLLVLPERLVRTEETDPSLRNGVGLLYRSLLLMLSSSIGVDWSRGVLILTTSSKLFMILSYVSAASIAACKSDGY